MQRIKLFDNLQILSLKKYHQSWGEFTTKESDTCMFVRNLGYVRPTILPISRVAFAILITSNNKEKSNHFCSNVY